MMADMMAYDTIACSDGSQVEFVSLRISAIARSWDSNVQIHQGHERVREEGKSAGGGYSGMVCLRSLPSIVSTYFSIVSFTPAAVGGRTSGRQMGGYRLQRQVGGCLAHGSCKLINLAYA